MKRYMVFGGNCFYAGGGANDFIGAWDDKDFAIEQAKGVVGKFAVKQWESDEEELETEFIEWVHVFDTLNKVKVYENEVSALGYNKLTIGFVNYEGE